MLLFYLQRQRVRLIKVTDNSDFCHANNPAFLPYKETECHACGCGPRRSNVFAAKQSFDHDKETKFSNGKNLKSKI